jgi:putative hydrolase of the HAD superfamily
MIRARVVPGPRVWLFDLDNTLHNASHSAFPQLNAAMTDYTVRALGVARAQADALRHHYWRRYGATMLGLVRHHGVDATHFLQHTHELPGLEARLELHRADIAAIACLPGRRYVLTNSPRAYAQRVLAELGLRRHFDAVLSIEDMRMFGHWRPKPDTRSLHRIAQRLRTRPSRCVLVEDAVENLKAAACVGMHTVWLQRWLKKAGHSALGQARPCRKASGVAQRVHHARQIRSV